MEYSQYLLEEFNSGLSDFFNGYPKDGLYAPIHYLLKIRGKRIRPLLALSVCEAEEADISKAMPAALAVELFHNFTLMHDDIMDDAPLRRGQASVHEEFSHNAAILSGDAMFTLASQAIELTSPEVLPELLSVFNRTAREVCEGQQLDMDFELRANVNVEEYLEMIRLKTSVLLASSCAMGAICAGATEERVKLWYRFGEKIGLAFQIQDDLLDTFGDPSKTGKQVGGDILADKKTFLWIHSAQHCKIGYNKSISPDEKISGVTTAMLDARADVAAKDLMQLYSSGALKSLDALELSPNKREWFDDLVNSVTQRTH